MPTPGEPPVKAVVMWKWGDLRRQRGVGNRSTRSHGAKGQRGHNPSGAQGSVYLQEGPPGLGECAPMQREQAPQVLLGVGVGWGVDTLCMSLQSNLGTQVCSGSRGCDTHLGHEAWGHRLCVCVCECVRVCVSVCVCECVLVLVTQPCPTLCDPMD